MNPKSKRIRQFDNSYPNYGEQRYKETCSESYKTTWNLNDFFFHSAKFGEQRYKDTCAEYYKTLWKWRLSRFCDIWVAKIQKDVLRISQKCVEMYDFCNIQSTSPCIFAPRSSHSEENKRFSSLCDIWVAKLRGDVLRISQTCVKMYDFHGNY